ncbi:SDR family oxidoreductase [Streptomyces sp. NBC_00322]|uniref:SDR family NAD(P)-dependent oxidoreductase n=1 Tax=Streptomyces sp. NBC_00322 TaxID=2975712 RepID=UPI002E2BC099|nr:SDR family oxidoreductase [Streptomyces sp. NBC_00322]
MALFPYADHTALVTGASSGLGAEFARQLAGRGANLILVARSADRLRALAAEIERTHSVRVDVVPTDLADCDAVQHLVGEIGDRVHLLVNSAGYGSYGRFATLDPGREYDQVLVNNAALVALTRAVLPAMLDRGNGGVVNVASTIAFQPGAYQAVYGATKAFVLSFSEAVRVETRGTGVRVLTLCPGPVDTGFLAGLGDDRAARTAIYSRLDRADRVVTVGLRAFDRDRGTVIPGFRNALLASAPRFAPRAVTAWISGRLLRPAS